MTNKIDNPGKVLNEQQLAQVEQQLGFRFPDDYKSFMLRSNGGRPELAQFSVQWSGQDWAEGWETDDVGDFYAIDEDDSPNLLDSVDTYAGRIPADTVPIGNDPFNNQLLLGVGGTNYGKVYLWMFSYEKDEDEPGPADYQNVGIVANSFNEFMNALRESE